MAAGIAVADALASRLEAYYQVLVTWNRKINLTGFDLSEPSSDFAFDRLLVEPIVAARHVRPDARGMVDIGSGGGSPAIPFALAARLKLLMVEAKTRKSVFLREAARAVGLADAEVATTRYEQLLTDSEGDGPHDVLTIRAVRVEGAVLTELRRFLRPSGHLFVFQRSATSIFVQAPRSLTVVTRVPLVPSNDSELIIFERSGR